MAESIMNRNGTRWVFGIAMALGFAASAVFAQDAPVRVRGTIAQVDGNALTIKARDGKDLKVTLAENAMVVALIKASVEDIKTGGFIGVTSLPQVDGSMHAVEVHIFPEAMRGTGEGHRPWDLLPNSTMTNATVDSTVASVDGQVLMMKYKDGEKKIIVPPTVEIVTYAPATMADLKPGEKVFVAAAKVLPDGTLEAPNITVSRGGVAPPM